MVPWVVPVIIGLAGWAGAGKDSVADILVEDFGFKKMAFADPLREMALAIDPVVGAAYPPEAEFSKQIRYSDALDLVGYNEAKFKYPEVRRFLQRLGTEAVRNVIGPNTWVEIGMRRAAEFPRVVFADMRFQNEAVAVANADEGITARVMRPGVEAANDHISETDLNSWSFHHVIDNSGSLSNLREMVGVMLDAIDPIT